MLKINLIAKKINKKCKNANLIKEKEKGPVPIVSQVRHWNLYSFTHFRGFSDTAEKNNDKFPTKVFHVNYCICLSENTATYLGMISWLQAWLLKLLVTDVTVVKCKQEGQSENQAFKHL